MRNSSWLSIGLLATSVTFGLVGCGDDDDDGDTGSQAGTTSASGNGGKANGGSSGSSAGKANGGSAGKNTGGSAPVGGEPGSEGGAGGSAGGDTGGVPSEGGASAGANAGGEGGAIGASTDVELHDNVFTDSAGFSLYLRKGDTASTTAPVSGCTAGCLGLWPVFGAEDPTLPAELSSADFASFERPDGATQATYKGWPLYYYAGDTKPGDTNGDGVGTIWHVVKLPFVAP